MKMPDIDTDQILSALGVARKPDPKTTLLEGVALFGLGVLVGAGVALLLAPKSGREVRADLTDRLEHARQRRARNAEADDATSVTAGQS